MPDHVPENASTPCNPWGSSVPTKPEVDNRFPSDPGITNKATDLDARKVATKDRVPQPGDSNWTGGSKPPVVPYG